MSIDLGFIQWYFSQLCRHPSTNCVIHISPTYKGEEYYILCEKCMQRILVPKFRVEQYKKHIASCLVSEQEEDK